MALNRPACRTRGAARALLVTAGLAAAGCSAAPLAGPDHLTVPADRYHEAFDAAQEAARREGLAVSVRDRRSGVIITDPEIAPSLLEPGRTHGESFSTTLESTLAFQRRRARFEFTPADRPAAAPGTGETDVLGLGPPPPDLTQAAGNLDLRVWVYRERAHTPGLRRSTWSRSYTSRSEIIKPGPIDEPPEIVPFSFWTPVTRDQTAERRLLAAIELMLNAPGQPGETPKR